MAIDMMAAFETEPPPLDFIWPGFVAGTVGALIAPGATGKSFWALEACMAVAAPDADLLDLKLAASGRVIYFAAEDPAPVLIRRLHAIGQHLSPEARVSVVNNLMLEPMLGKRPDLSNDRHLSSIVDYCTAARLVVIDTLSRFHACDENDNGAMAGIVARLASIADQTGAGVLYLHHTSKSAATQGQGDQQQAARGASALVDNARWCGYVAKMSKSEADNLSNRTFDRAPIADQRGFFVKFGVSKENYGFFGAERWFERRDGGVLRPVALVPAIANGGQSGRRGKRGEA